MTEFDEPVAWWDEEGVRLRYSDKVAVPKGTPLYLHPQSFKCQLLTTEENDEFDRISNENDIKSGQPYYSEVFVSVSQRNKVLEEVAKEIDKMPFGDTAQSFATFVRNMKG